MGARGKGGEHSGVAAAGVGDALAAVVGDVREHRVAELAQVRQALDPPRSSTYLFAAGSSSATSSAMIPMTTSSSTSVNAPARRHGAMRNERLGMSFPSTPAESFDSRLPREV